MSDADVVVIGGGIHGCSAALNIARRGMRVVLLERDHVGRHASSANAGGVRTLLRHPAEVPLALASRRIWHDIRADVGTDCEYHTVGQVAVAETDAALANLEDRARLMARLGHGHEELLDTAELQRLLPGIADYVRGGLVVREDGAASPFHATRAYRDAAVREGVRILEGAEVRSLEIGDTGVRVHHSNGWVRASRIVNAAGAWGDDIAGMAGDHLPLGFFCPMMMVTARVDRFLGPVVINDTRPLSFKQMPNGTLLIGGGRPAKGDRRTLEYRLDFTGLKAGARTVAELFPSVGDVVIVRGWAGFEGRFADDIPVIGRGMAAPERVVHAFGFCGHGFQLGPVVGRIVADLIAGEEPQLPIEAFAPERFAAPEHCQERSDHAAPA